MIKDQLKSSGMRFFAVIVALSILITSGIPYIIDSRFGWIITDATSPYRLEEPVEVKYGPNGGIVSGNYELLPNGKFAPLTQLSEEGMKQQTEEGCIGCHE